MCRAQVFDIFLYSDDPRRGTPRLEFAIPVNIVKLAENLEAYYRAEEKVKTLRLCHRSEKGLLSELSQDFPQEVLEMIITEIQRPEETDEPSVWEKSFTCFQNRCEPVHHRDLADYKRPRRCGKCFFKNSCRGCEKCGASDKDGKEYYGRCDMCGRCDICNEDAYDTDGFLDPTWDDNAEEIHESCRWAWIQNVCLCKRSYKSQFMEMNNFLNSRFGLQICVLHEFLSSRLVYFLPVSSHNNDDWYYSSAFLILASPDSNGTPIFLPAAFHLAEKQVVDPIKFILSENQRRRFSKAMRELRLVPEYHLTNMDSLVTEMRIPDQDQWNDRDRKLDSARFFSRINEPAFMESASTDSASEPTISDRLEQYIGMKNKELAKEDWPKLYCLEASDAVITDD